MAKKSYIIPYNVITEINGNFVGRDIMPYLIGEFEKKYKKDKNKILFSKKDIKDFLISTSRYRYWARCQYEIILSDWPCKQVEQKIDVFQQIQMNIEVVLTIFAANLIELKYNLE